MAHGQRTKRMLKISNKVMYCGGEEIHYSAHQKKDYGPSIMVCQNVVFGFLSIWLHLIFQPTLELAISNIFMSSEIYVLHLNVFASHIKENDSRTLSNDLSRMVKTKCWQVITVSKQEDCWSSTPGCVTRLEILPPELNSYPRFRDAERVKCVLTVDSIFPNQNTYQTHFKCPKQRHHKIL